MVDLDQMCFPLEEQQPINIFGKTNQFFQGNHRTLELTRWREGSASAGVGNCSLELVLLRKISVQAFPVPGRKTKTCRRRVGSVFAVESVESLKMFQTVN